MHFRVYICFGYQYRQARFGCRMHEMVANTCGIVKERHEKQIALRAKHNLKIVPTAGWDARRLYCGRQWLHTASDRYGRARDARPHSERCSRHAQSSGCARQRQMTSGYLISPYRRHRHSRLDRKRNLHIVRHLRQCQVSTAPGCPEFCLLFQCRWCNQSNSAPSNTHSSERQQTARSTPDQWQTK